MGDQSKHFSNETPVMLLLEWLDLHFSKKGPLQVYPAEILEPGLIVDM